MVEDQQTASSNGNEDREIDSIPLSSKSKSDEIVAELLRDVERSEKPFSLEDIELASKSRKNKKDHKHKKSKKKRKRSHSRTRKRSRSPNRKRSHRGTPHRSSRSRSSSWSSTAKQSNAKKEHVAVKPIAADSFVDQVSEEDDLPVGADFRTVFRETKLTINIGGKSEKPLQLELLPSKPGCSTPKDLLETFPIAKENKESVEEGSLSCGKNQSELLKKVLDEKGKADFVPRNVKVKSGTSGSNPQCEVLTEKDNVAEKDPSRTSGVSAEEFGPVPPSTFTCAVNISDSELEKKIEKDLTAEPKPSQTNSDRWTKIIENSVAVIDGKKTSKRRRRGSSSSATDDEIRRKTLSTRKRSSPRRSRRSRSRSRDRRRSSPRKNNRKRYSRSRSRKRSYSNRKHSRSPVYSSSSKRRSRSRERTRSRRHSRSRSPACSSSRSDNRTKGAIDKAKLLEIARSRAQRAKEVGLFDAKDANPKSIDDFVSYCEKIQKKQHKEDRREKGEDVSSEDEATNLSSTFKHPFGVRPAEGIKINIVNATPLATKTAQECILDSSQLRLVFPVSSGTVHKENTDEWKKVEPCPAPISCSVEQKKYVAVTSLEVEKGEVACKEPRSNLSSALPFLPPPPAPPTSLPTLPSRRTAFDSLLPPPPPLPPMLVVPQKEDMIMAEPERVTQSAPRDVSRVLAQRARAQRSLADNPNNYEAMQLLKEADDQMAAWAAARNEPGKFTGSTGVNVLAPDALQPQDPRYHAWVKKDMFKNARPAVGGMGMRLMQKMGWRPGDGLGKDGSGCTEPLTLEVKSDRKGLLTNEDLPARSSAKTRSVVPTDISGKNPISLVMELCTKRRWGAPSFECIEMGTPVNREFLWKVTVNGVEYQPVTASRNKKSGKAVACQVVLQSLGLIPRDANLPVVI